MSFAVILSMVCGGVTVVGFIIAQIILLAKFGRLYGRMEKTQEQQDEEITALKGIIKNLAEIPLLTQRVGQLEETVRKNTSDISRLRISDAEQRVKLDSIDLE